MCGIENAVSRGSAVVITLPEETPRLYIPHTTAAIYHSQYMRIEFQHGCTHTQTNQSKHATASLELKAKGYRSSKARELPGNRLAATEVNNCPSEEV